MAKKRRKTKPKAEPDWRSSLWLKSEHRDQLDRITAKVHDTTGQRLTQSQLVVAILDCALPVLDDTEPDPDLVAAAWVRKELGA